MITELRSWNVLQIGRAGNGMTGKRTLMVW